MFHKRTGQIAAIIMLLSVSAHPMITYAAEKAPPAVTASVNPSAHLNTTSAEGFSLEALRKSSKSKLTDTQLWVRDKTQGRSLKKSIKTLELKIDRLQDRTKPLGRSLKAAIKKHAPGKNIVQKGDRTFSVYGILLFLAFGLVIFLMSMSGPTSRLGGRH